jgi:hypothetical protein
VFVQKVAYASANLLNIRKKQISQAMLKAKVNNSSPKNKAAPFSLCCLPGKLQVCMHGTENRAYKKFAK